MFFKGLPEQVTLRTTDLQELFDHFETSETPSQEWRLAQGPDTVTVRTTELQRLLEQVDPGAFQNKVITIF